MINEELQQQIEHLEQQIKDLKVKLEEKAEKKPYEVEVPEDIDDYYYTNEYGKVEYLEGYNSSYEKNKYIRGLAFKTTEEAEQHDKERILLFKMHKWAEEHNGGWTPHGNNTFNFYIIYRNSDKTLDVNWCSGIRKFSKLPYFNSKRLAQQFIEEFGEDIKEVLC